MVVAGSVAATFLALGLPSTAIGATAAVSGGTLTFTAQSGEENDVTVEPVSGVFRVIDNAAPVTAGTNCTQRSVHRVNCSMAGVTLVRAELADKDDSVAALIGSVDAELTGGRGFDNLTSQEGNDTLRAGGGGRGFIQEVLNGGGGDDVLHGSTTATALLGGLGDDELHGGTGSDQLFGDAGADLMEGGDGFDFTSWAGTAAIDVSLDGVANDGEAGEGDNVTEVEFLSGTPFNDTLTGTDGEQSLQGGGGKDTLDGGSAGDSLDGGDGADTLMGGDGPDFLIGGPRADDQSGGPGIDTASFDDGRISKVTVTINNVADDGTGGEADNVRTDIEQLSGGPNDDLLIGSGQDNEIIGRGGDDNVQGGGGDDRLFGDNLFSSPAAGADTLGGGGGDDELFGGLGPDQFNGGDDYDFADYSQPVTASSLTVSIDNVANDGLAGEGDDVRDTVEGVVGGDGSDTITGSGEANTLFGGGGVDNLNGGNGPDFLDGETPGTFFGFVGDTLSGGSGNDTVSYRSHGFFPGVVVDIDGVADDGLSGEGDNVMTNVENLIGSGGSDHLIGNSGANTIAGREGSDTLEGGAGSDSLAGGQSSDTHEGQAGKDEINSKDAIFDNVNCGTETDTVIPDSFDNVNADCENSI